MTSLPADCAASRSGQVEWSKEFAFQVANILDNRTNQRVETRVTTLGFPVTDFRSGLPSATGYF